MRQLLKRYGDTSVKMRFRAARLIATKFTSIKSPTRITAGKFIVALNDVTPPRYDRDNYNCDIRIITCYCRLYVSRVGATLRRSCNFILKRVGIRSSIGWRWRVSERKEESVSEKETVSMIILIWELEIPKKSLRYNSIVAITVAAPIMKLATSPEPVATFDSSRSKGDLYGSKVGGALESTPLVFLGTIRRARRCR